MYLNVPTELLGHEELVRLVYYSHKLRNELGIDIKSAMIDDVPGYTWALPQILCGAGIRYLSVRANPYHAAPLWQKASGKGFSAELPRWQGISRPFFWQSPQKDKILTWYCDSYREANFFRLASDPDHPFEDIIADIVRRNEEVGFPCDILQLRMGGDNIDAVIAPCEHAREWNRRWAYPKITIATNSDFFKFIESNYGDDFPVFSGDIPAWWADGPGSSARETGINRITHDRLAAAESFSTLASFLHGTQHYPAGEIDKAYDDMMLYDEHTWGASASIGKPFSLQTLGQWAVKSSFSYKAAIRTEEILKKALNGIAGRIKTPKKDAESVAVFNSLSWERSDVVRLHVPVESLKGNRLCRIIDVQSGDSLPCQIVAEESESVIIVFCAQNVPALGYKMYKMVPVDSSSDHKSTISGTNAELENKFYKILSDPITGGITSIVDKELNREFVDQGSSYKVNQYIYERYRDGRDAFCDAEKQKQFQRSSPASAILGHGMEGPVMGSILINTSGEGCPAIRQEVILYEDIKRIDVVNILSKEETLEPEGVYYAYAFNVENPSFKCEIADAIFTPETDQLAGSARDYYSIQHWLDVSNLRYGVTWAAAEAPLVQLCDINTGKWLKKLEITNATFFSYIMNNYWTVNFKANQGGDLTFRYGFTTHTGGYDASEATRFGWGYSNPLIGIPLSENEKASLPDNFSFCRIDKPNANFLVMKPAEDGKGYIVRLQEVAGKEGPVRVTLPYLKSIDAHLTTIIEENIKQLDTQTNTVNVPLRPFGVATIRIQAKV